MYVYRPYNDYAMSSLTLGELTGGRGCGGACDRSLEENDIYIYIYIHGYIYIYIQIPIEDNTASLIYIYIHIYIYIYIYILYTHD